MDEGGVDSPTDPESAFLTLSNAADSKFCWRCGRHPTLRSGRALDAWVLPYQAAIPDSHAQFADGELNAPDLRERVETLGTELVRYAGVASSPEDATAPVAGD